MSSLYLMLATAAVLALLVWVAKRAGKQEQRADDAEKSLDAASKAGAVRDRLNRDPDFASRVRDRFKR